MCAFAHTHRRMLGEMLHHQHFPAKLRIGVEVGTLHSLFSTLRVFLSLQPIPNAAGWYLINQSRRGYGSDKGNWPNGLHISALPISGYYILTTQWLNES